MHTTEKFFSIYIKQPRKNLKKINPQSIRKDLDNKFSKYILNNKNNKKKPMKQTVKILI